jgi:predicted RND superfamily exporter protein
MKELHILLELLEKEHKHHILSVEDLINIIKETIKIRAVEQQKADDLQARYDEIRSNVSNTGNRLLINQQSEDEDEDFDDPDDFG